MRRSHLVGIEGYLPKELEVITGEVPPWYKQIGEPVILSSILAPEMKSPLDDPSFMISRLLADPRNLSCSLSDIDAYRRLRGEEVIRCLSCDPDARHRLQLFEQHIGYQFYKNLANPHRYLKLE